MHTATPWSIDQYGDVKSGRKTVFVNGFAFPAGFSNRLAEENTDFIIRAVNSYASLVSAVELALKTILDEAEVRDFNPPANTALVAELEAAIAIAKGEQA